MLRRNSFVPTFRAHARTVLHAREMLPLDSGRGRRWFRAAIGVCLVGSVVLAGCGRRGGDQDRARGASRKARVEGGGAGYGFEEGGGTTTADSSGNHLDGTVKGAVWRKGKFG